MNRNTSPAPKGVLKPYNISILGDNDAEISLYGEVVSTRPTDWWTGDSIPGNFIALDEFMKDLDELGSKDNVTVHINSVGGDMYAGIAIFNRLKGLAANITTINDGLAASAGSIIFMAGNTRKVNAGSNLMIHGASYFLCGRYQTQDLTTIIKQLDAHNQAATNIYVAATGRTEPEVKAIVQAETWLTGQEAVDAGFADEVISEVNESIQMCMTPDKSALMVNGYPVAAHCLSNIPKNIPVMTEDDWAMVSKKKPAEAPTSNHMQPAPQESINKSISGGKDHMDIKNMDELRAAFPDLLAQVEAAAKSDGVAAERARIKGIEEIENAIGNSDLINKAKFGETPMNAEQLAFAAMKAQAAIGAKVLDNLVDDAQNSGASGVQPTQNGPVEMTDDEKAQNLLFSCIANKKEGK